MNYYSDDASLTDTFVEYFEYLEATEPEEAPNWDPMQNAPQREKAFPENKSFDPVYTD